MQNTTILKKNKNMVTRKIADETILLPIYKTSKEINCIYTLNKPASIVWDMIDGKTTVGEIKDKVLNNGFDLGKGTKAQSNKGTKSNDDSRFTKYASRDARKEVDSQLKVFFGELKEIKAVIREKARCKSQKTKNRRGGACLLPLLTKKGRKMKFRPEITRVKLNPEQAVLSCACYTNWTPQGHGRTVVRLGGTGWLFRAPAVVNPLHTGCFQRAHYPLTSQATDDCWGGDVSAGVS